MTTKKRNSPEKDKWNEKKNTPTHSQKNLEKLALIHSAVMKRVPHQEKPQRISGL